MVHYNSTWNLFQIWNRFYCCSSPHKMVKPKVGHIYVFLQQPDPTMSVTFSCWSQHFKDSSTLEHIYFSLSTCLWRLQAFFRDAANSYLIYLARKLAFSSGGFSTQSPDVARHFVYSKLESLGSYRIKMGIPCKYWCLPVWVNSFSHTLGFIGTSASPRI